MPRPTHVIGGHPAAITVNTARDYEWTLWTSKQTLTGKAKSPEEAIDAMKAIACPVKVK